MQRQTFVGLLARLLSPDFLFDLALLCDVLQGLSKLPLQLQNRTMTIPNAQIYIRRTIRVFQSFKDAPGEMLTEASAALDSDDLLSR